MAASTLADVSKAGDANGAPAGSFVRKEAVFRNAVVAKPTGDAEDVFVAESGRYLLYVSYACPWASRCLSFLALKGLEDAIEVAVVSPQWTATKPDVDDHRGWTFDAKYPGATPDPVFGARTIREVYERAVEGLDMEAPIRFTVPVLFDKKTRRIVNNESAEIIRFFNSEFNAFSRYPEVDLYPAPYREQIDAFNESIYETVNNGVYKCGFAQSQEAYDFAIGPLFKRLDELDALLASQRYVIQAAGLTESDIRLFVTLARFDAVYYVHFKCSVKLIREYPHLSRWLRDVYQTGRLAPTVQMKHIKDLYYGSLPSINPYGIVPVNTPTDFESPHGRTEVPL